MNAALLRRALDDALVADDLTPPLSENMKLDYVICLRELQEQRQALGEIPLPGGPHGWLEKAATAARVKNHVQRARLHATNDVERSRRVLRLLYANWLAQVDRPAGQRARIAIQLPNVIFAADPSAPPAASAIAPEDLRAAIDQTLLAACFFRPLSSTTSSQDAWSESYWQPNGRLAREPRRRAVLIVKLAAELYCREQGKPPAKVVHAARGLSQGIAAGCQARRTDSRRNRLTRDAGRSCMETRTTQPAAVVTGDTKLTRLTRFRLIALAVISAIAIVAGTFVWRMRSLNELPDVGDPFDVALASRPVFVADVHNAYVSYSEAPDADQASRCDAAGGLGETDLAEGRNERPRVPARKPACARRMA